MSIYDQMLAAYPQQTAQQQHNARIEVAQQIVLMCRCILSTCKSAYDNATTSS